MMATTSKAERKFTKTLRELLHQARLQPQWEVTTTDGYKRPWAGWESFKRGSYDVAAVAPVTVNDRTYWVVARMITDPEKLVDPLMMGGLLGVAIASLFIRTEVDVALWYVDPRELKTGQPWYSNATNGSYVWAHQVELAKL